MTFDRKAFFVVNPNSANASTGRQWPEMEARIEDAIGSFDWEFTDSPGHASALAREAAEKNYDLVVAVGGDGTNNEVINGLFTEGRAVRPELAFSFICRGTGGDFRKSFGWSLDLDEAVERLKSDKTRRIDIGRFSYHDHEDEGREAYFINITSFGISGLVDHYVNNSTKIFGGKASFMIGTARALMRYRNQKIRLRVDETFDEEIRANLVAVANGRFFGGGMMIAPEAEVDDGLFDIVIIGDVSRFELARNNSRVYKGTHLSLPKMRHLRGRKVIADSPERVLIDMDGEQPGSLPCSFDILPGALALKV